MEERASQFIWQEECALWKFLRAHQSCWCAQLGTLEADLGRNNRAYDRDIGSLPIAAGIIIVCHKLVVVLCSNLYLTIMNVPIFYTMVNFWGIYLGKCKF